MKRTVTIRVDRDFYMYISDFRRRMETRRNERIAFTDATRMLTKYLKDKDVRKRRKYNSGFFDAFGL